MDTDTLRTELANLIFGYWDQPAFSQKCDLQRINEIRTQLGMTVVDASLKPVKGEVASARKSTTDKPVPDKHIRSREIYAQYLAKVAELAPHREYALQVEKATVGTGMTPVEPLATMGCGGGPLLCDVCGKPMILEGGGFQGVYADVAWAKKSEVNRINWRSYISGGMVVENQTNGTIRIYHGHTYGAAKECATIAHNQSEEAQKAHSNAELVANCKVVTEFVSEMKLSPSDTHRLINDILNTVFGYDPGIGINKPEIS